jgi:hypothetical protein
MKFRVFGFMVLISSLPVIPQCSFAQTIWDGPYETFEKVSNADWTLEENQDRITDLVWITRKTNQGIFNIAAESGYIMNVSPVGTEWAMGSTENLAELIFDDWRSTVGGNPQSSLDQEMVLHLIEEDIFIDITFQEWQSLSGGAFRYKRRTDPALSLPFNRQPKQVFVFPNPSQDYLKLTEKIGTVSYSIFNAKGEHIGEGEWNTVEALDISFLEPGVYTLHSHALTFRFLKNEK